MVRAAALASGDGARLQAILDAVYFNEIPNFSLEAVICPQRACYAMTRSLNAGVPAYVVDPELFPNMTSHSIAVANKLKDMDIELVILAGYDAPLGVIPYQFKNRVIGTVPALYPAFHDSEGDPVALTLDSGLKVAGATAYFSDGDGRVGAVILQRLEAGKPFQLDFAGDLEGHRRGPRARPVGIAEGKAGHEAAGIHRPERILEFLFRFAREAHNQVRRKGEIRPGAAQPLHHGKVALHAVAPAHPAQHGTGTHDVRPPPEYISLYIWSSYYRPVYGRHLLFFSQKSKEPET